MIFENFMYGVLRKLRADKKSADKPIVVFLDNASTHMLEPLKILAAKLG